MAGLERFSINFLCGVQEAQPLASFCITPPRLLLYDHPMPGPETLAPIASRLPAPAPALPPTPDPLVVTHTTVCRSRSSSNKTRRIASSAVPSGFVRAPGGVDEAHPYEHHVLDDKNHVPGMAVLVHKNAPRPVMPRASREGAAQTFWPVFACDWCGITATPERRQGPRGRRTLCNACGLRYAKQEKEKKAKKNAQPTGHNGLALHTSATGDVVGVSECHAHKPRSKAQVSVGL